ncbi:MAG: adenylate/guanylate cyclase domain-containing protein [Planctomycetaceae bacterium]|nr:adenylate/guanylate cyclase domain-containing protein [Planctomycetaceae bacterium]
MTSTSIRFLCFTDIKGSTALTQSLGHSKYMPLLREHLQEGEALATACGGVYVKNIGDAHFAQFDSVESALKFATQFQQLVTSRSGLRDDCFEIRIGLSQGAVVPTSGDVFGAGVNEGARVQAVAEPGQVTCNRQFKETARAALSGGGVDAYFGSVGVKTLKGLEPEQQEVFYFDWQKYASVEHTHSLASQVESHLGDSRIELSNVSTRDLATSSVLIWPVVPREIVTAIHRGQFEVIRLLQMLGWRLRILLADCGGESQYDSSDLTLFESRLRRYANTRDVVIDSIERMSGLYEPSHRGYAQLHAKFRSITSKMTVEELLNINNKHYGREITDKIAKRATLTYLRAPLTIAAVFGIAECAKGKCLILAGQDEQYQWSTLYNLRGCYETLGVLMIPMLKENDKDQAQQLKNGPIWHSREQLEKAIRSDTGNTLWWLSMLFGLLPSFLRSTEALQGVTTLKRPEFLGCPKNFPVDELISRMWPFLNPAH